MKNFDDVSLVLPYAILSGGKVRVGIMGLDGPSSPAERSRPGHRLLCTARPVLGGPLWHDPRIIPFPAYIIRRYLQEKKSTESILKDNCQVKEGEITSLRLTHSQVSFFVFIS